LISDECNVLILNMNILAQKMLIPLIKGKGKSVKQLETIKLQSASGLESITERQPLGLADEVIDGPDHRGSVEAVVYNHVSGPGYFAIRLFWSSGPSQVQGSPLGMRITQTLNTFGLLDHSMWIEKEKKGEWA
jgi:hypothetical protein